MDTLTMIEDAINNPTQQYQTNCGKVYYKNGELRWVDSNCLFNINSETLKLKWRPIEKLTDIKTALEAYQNDGKTITCYWKGGFYSYIRQGKGLIDNYGKPIIASEILEGEWYIED